VNSPFLTSAAKRRTAIAAAFLAVPLLGACGFGAQTDKIYQAAAGPNDRSGDVAVLNATIVSGVNGRGTFAGTLVNGTDAPVALTSVTGEGVSAETADNQAIEVPAYGAENLGVAGETVPPVKLAIYGTDEGIRPGRYVELTFTFSSGPAVTMRVPVVAVTEDYEDVPLPAKKAEPKGKKAASDAPAAE
jgi:hypothetical protein